MKPGENFWTLFPFQAGGLTFHVYPRAAMPAISCAHFADCHLNQAVFSASTPIQKKTLIFHRDPVSNVGVLLLSVENWRSCGNFNSSMVIKVTLVGHPSGAGIQCWSELRDTCAVNCAANPTSKWGCFHGQPGCINEASDTSLRLSVRSVKFFFVNPAFEYFAVPLAA